MQKCNPLFILVTTLLLLFRPTIALEAVQQEIKTIESMKDLPTSHPEGTLILFDIDDTLFDSPYMMGSKMWRKYLVSKLINDQCNWHDRLTLYLNQNLKFISLEPITPSIVNALKNNGAVVAGLTARERQIWYHTPAPNIDQMTIFELKNAGFNFDTKAVETAYPELTTAPEYYEGVFFAHIEDKGDYLKQLFNSFDAQAKKPIKIVFIDDKLAQVESVKKFSEEFQIEYEGYWYIASDIKAAKFDPLIANIQFWHYMTKNGEELTEEQAEAFAKAHPGKATDEYFQLVLEYCMQNQ